MTPRYQQLLTDVLKFWMSNGYLVLCIYASLSLFTKCPGCKSSMRQASGAAGVQVQPDSQSKPRQTPAAGTLCHPGSKWKNTKQNQLSTALLSSSSPTQGAFTACAKVSELQVFTHTAEVKVDPDKPLEGARLAVLQVALHCGEKETLCFWLHYRHLFTLSYLSCDHVSLTCTWGS